MSAPVTQPLQRGGGAAELASRLSCQPQSAALGPVGAVISLLHEPANHSARRKFRDRPVLGWTLERLSSAQKIDAVGIICWEDQAADVRVAVAAVDRPAVKILAKPRQRLPNVEAVGAARRWSDGWRGGLLQTCHFDAGFHGPWVLELLQLLQCDRALLIEPSSGLIDPALLDDLIAHADAHGAMELCFAPAAPGFGAALLAKCLVDRLADARTHPGRVLCYNPDQPVHDPIARDGCAAAPVPVVRANGHYRLDSARQIEQLTAALASLNGTLKSAPATTIVTLASAQQSKTPREIVLELTTSRASTPIFQPLAHLEINRPPMPRHIWQAVLADLAETGADDLRLTLAGVGDPLEHPELFDLLEAANKVGIAIHIETDLLCEKDPVDRLASGRADVLSIHIPALTAPAYQQIMGVDGLARVLENINHLAKARRIQNSGTPLIVPLFVKCRQNLGEMEQWYDRWLRAVSSAVIRGAGDFAGQIPNHEAADMSPPRRVPCARLASRLTILCDGTIIACEQDFAARQPLGRIGSDKIADVFADKLATLRDAHNAGNFDCHPLCSKCRDWHRP
jgi:hypothetical protein